MIFEQGFDVNFVYEGRNYTCKVYKMIITDMRPQKFYRIYSPKGNRDIIKHDGQWMIFSGNRIPLEILDAIGAQIEKIIIKEF